MYETELDWVYSFGRPQSGLMVKNLDSGAYNGSFDADRSK